MKKESTKALVKSARKAAKKDIEVTLLNGLHEVTAKLSQSSKKLEKQIQKGAKQLAKKLAQELKIDKAAFAPQVATEEVAAPAVS